MRLRRLASSSLLLLLGLLVPEACSSSKSSPAASEDAGPDPESFSTPPASCAFTCPNSACSEATTPYACPNLGAWASVPHAETCPAWDGTYPTVKQGQCTASVPAGDAIVPAQKTGTPIVLPDGRRITPAGGDWLFDETDVPESLPVSILLVPGTSFALVVDVGYQNNALRVVDTTLIGTTTNPTVSYVTFPSPSLLNRGMALVAPNHVYVATDDGIVQAFSIDLTAGTLTTDSTRDITLPGSVNDENQPANFYVEGVAASPDGTKLVVTSVFDSRLLVFDVDETSATRGKQLGEVGLGATQTFGAWFDPNDTTGSTVYVSSIEGQEVLEVDVSTPTAPAVKQKLKTLEGPQGIAFLDARFMAVASDMADSVGIVDRVTNTVTNVAVGTDGLFGLEPSTLAYDATNSILYATLAGANAVDAWNVDHTTTPPTLTPAGMLGTAWWPTDVAVTADGSLVVTALKGHGAGPYLETLPPDSGDGMAGSGGGIQLVPTPTAATLAAGASQVAANDHVGALAGVPTVQCPPGASDFPVPATNTTGASAAIQHVFLVVRENKAFDAIFGDFPDVNGDAALTAKATTAELDTLWKNERALARAFAISDDYYTDAEISVQGHYWTTTGRTSDLTERTWFEAGGYSRSAAVSPVPIPGVAGYSEPPNGSLFGWLDTNKIAYDVLGEGDGNPTNIDTYYPGGFIQSIGHPDNEKACYVAGRARVLCDLPQLIYMTLPNDHCNGTDPSTPSPETMIAVNDEATGMLVDGLSNSPLWASSLVVVIEDDPQQGGDHVDKHRSPMLIASPWVKHGYVSHTHIDVASLVKVFANVLGVPYPNQLVANAALPFDLFTSTPDYTPYTYAPRAVPLTCGEDATRDEVNASKRWDFSHVDSQPGFDAHIARWLRGHDVMGHVKPGNAKPAP